MTEEKFLILYILSCKMFFPSDNNDVMRFSLQHLLCREFHHRCATIY